MIVTILKGSFVKRGPKIIMYRDFKIYDVDRFRYALKESLNEINILGTNFSEFNERVETVLNEHAPIETKCSRTDDSPFMANSLAQEVYIHSHQPPQLV